MSPYSNYSKLNSCLFIFVSVDETGSLMSIEEDEKKPLAVFNFAAKDIVLLLDKKRFVFQLLLI